MAGQRGFRPEVELTASLAGRRARPPLGELLDLSTRFNRYGPPEAVLAALHSLTASDIQLPAAAAADRLEARYAQVLGSDQSELVAGRGTPELLAALAGQVPHGSVAVPLPTSSDILWRWPRPQAGRRGRGSAPCSPLGLPVEIVRAAVGTTPSVTCGDVPPACSASDQNRKSGVERSAIGRRLLAMRPMTAGQAADAAPTDALRPTSPGMAR